MDLTSEESKLINKFIHDWSKDKKLELETTFGIGGVIDSNTFLHIAQRLRNKGFEVIPQDDRLSIITPNYIRLSLQGLGAIQQYCNDNMLQGKAFNAMFKDRAFPDSNIDLKEYNVRFKIRREEELSSNDPRVMDIIHKWDTQKKGFRLIRRWTFQGKGVRFDMSMVRQTRNLPGKGEYDWTTNFIESNILQEIPRYEMEVELLHDTDYTNTPEKALKALIVGVGEVLRAIQKNSLLIRNSISNAVINEYKNVINSDKLRGVSPITLEVKNMITDIDESIPNIRNGFNVTDKADGLRTMGFVNKEGELFLIDMSMTIYRTGLKNKKCALSLVDGEWVTLSKHNAAINHYLIFDVYNYNGKSVSQLPFITFEDNVLNKEDQSRFNIMNDWYNKWKDGYTVISKGITDYNRLVIAIKHFEFATPKSDAIFKGCSNILDTSRIYNTDGLILTSNSHGIPDKSGVRWDYQFKWKPSKDNTIDFLINFEKNVDIPNVDKITTTIHPNSGNTVQYKTMRLFVGGDKESSLLNPRQTILLQQPLPKDKDSGRYRPILFNPIELPDTMANTCHVNIMIDPETTEEYAVTESNEPIPDRSIIEMRYDPTRDPGWRWIPSRIRYDKTERLQQAIAKKGQTKYTGTLNNEGTANSVWNSIHIPVTLSMIRSGNEEPIEDEIKDITKSRESDISKKYYERKAPQENIALIRGLLDFHNKYIKSEILIKRVLRGGNKSLVDVACGKGGDLFKWLFGKARYVIGIDYAGDNIMDPSNGIYKRYVDALIEFGPDRVPKMAFVIGDSSKNIISGEAGTTPEESDILCSVFGKYPSKGPVPKYIENVMVGSFRAGADVAACMFAIHYFFENVDKLDGFLKNLSEIVKVGGYFIGCCFDGDKIFHLLKTVEKGHSKIGKETDVPIWTITKDYDKEDLTTDDDSIGLGIDVEFISIGATHKEYLVPFELLKRKLSVIGFELLDATNLKELGLTSSTDTFDVTYEKSSKKYSMPESVKQFSFLNRWFIFKRIGETAIPKIVLDPLDLEEEVKEVEEVEEKVQESLPSRDRKFKDTELFRFGATARQVDIGVKDEKGGKDMNVSRWLGISALFPIPDPDEPVKYPSIEHYIAAMKLKYASNNPDLAKSLMSTDGKIHQKYTLKRSTVKNPSPPYDELLLEESNEVMKAMTKTSLNSFRTIIDEKKWIPVKDKVLMDALSYRWEHDKRFRDTVEAVRNAGKYLLYSTKFASVASELGGTRSLSTSTIEGDNKVGRFIMEIAGFKF